MNDGMNHRMNGRMNDLKDIWKKIDSAKDRPEYTMEEIAAFRDARSGDFTTWIRTGLGIDLALKILVMIVMMVLAFIFRFQPVVLIFCLISIFLLVFLIPYEYAVRRRAADLDRRDASIQELLMAKIDFLRGMYNRVQFIQGLTNPLLVIAGTLIYFHLTYRLVPPLDFRDFLILGTIIVLSYMITLPANLATYGFQLRNLQGCLSSLTDPEGYEEEARRFERRRKMLTILLYGLLGVGVVLLVLVVVL
jgi:hypothetical protein